MTKRNILILIFWNVSQIYHQNSLYYPWFRLLYIRHKVYGSAFKKSRLCLLVGNETMYINSDCSSIGQHNYNLHNQLKNNFEGKFFSSKIRRNKRGFNGVISNNNLLATSDCCYKFLDSWHICWPKEKLCLLLYFETFCGRHIF